MTNLHVNLHLEHTCPVESAYISASSSASSTDGIYAIGISWKPEKSRYFYMVQGTVQMQNTGKPEEVS